MYGDLEAINEFYNFPINGNKLNDVMNDIGFRVMAGEIDAKDYIEMYDRMEILLFVLGPVISPAPTVDTFMIKPNVRKRRTEMIAERKDRLEAGDATAIDEIEKELIDMSKERFQDTAMADVFDSGAKLKYDKQYREIALLGGILPQAPGQAPYLSTNNLMDGYKADSVFRGANTGVSGGVARGKQTAIGGYKVKQIQALMGGVKSGVAGTDCGTTMFLEIPVKSVRDIIFRYVKDGKGIKMVTLEDAHNYVGKVATVRSPMYCKHKSPCNKCLGDMYYLMFDTEGSVMIGLQTFKIGSEIMQKYMKLVHDINIKLVDVGDITEHIIEAKI